MEYALLGHNLKLRGREGEILLLFERKASLILERWRFLGYHRLSQHDSGSVQLFLRIIWS